MIICVLSALFAFTCLTTSFSMQSIKNIDFTNQYGMKEIKDSSVFTFKDANIAYVYLFCTALKHLQGACFYPASLENAKIILESLRSKVESNPNAETFTEALKEIEVCDEFITLLEQDPNQRRERMLMKERFIVMEDLNLALRDGRTLNGIYKRLQTLVYQVIRRVEPLIKEMKDDRIVVYRDLEKVESPEEKKAAAMELIDPTFMDIVLNDNLAGTINFNNYARVYEWTGNWN